MHGTRVETKTLFFLLSTITLGKEHSKIPTIPIPAGKTDHPKDFHLHRDWYMIKSKVWWCDLACLRCFVSAAIPHMAIVASWTLHIRRFEYWSRAYPYIICFGTSGAGSGLPCTKWIWWWMAKLRPSGRHWRFKVMIPLLWVIHLKV